MKKKLLLLSLLTATFFVNAQNVGIGTLTPQAKLDVNGSIKANSLAIATGGNPSDFLIKNDAAGNVSFRKGYAGLGISYIIAVDNSYHFPSSTEIPPYNGTYVREIRLFSGSQLPSGWAYCDGQLLSTTVNSTLFLSIGTTYGGNGTTNFAVPDLRAAVPVGAGANWMLGERSN